MRTLGILLMLSGWLILITAIAILHADTGRLGFAAAGVAIQCLGMGLLLFGYSSAAKHSGAA